MNTQNYRWRLHYRYLVLVLVLYLPPILLLSLVVTPHYSFAVNVVLGLILGFILFLVADRCFPSISKLTCPDCRSIEFRVVQISGQLRGETFYRCEVCRALFCNGVRRHTNQQ